MIPAANAAARLNRDALRRWARARGFNWWRASPYWLVEYPDGCDSAYVRDGDLAALDVAGWIEAFEAMAAARTAAVRALRWALHQAGCVTDACKSGYWRVQSGGGESYVDAGSRLTSALRRGAPREVLATICRDQHWGGSVDFLFDQGTDPPDGVVERALEEETGDAEFDTWDGDIGVVPVYPDAHRCASLDAWAGQVICAWREAAVRDARLRFDTYWRDLLWHTSGDTWDGRTFWCPLASAAIARDQPLGWATDAHALLVAEHGAASRDAALAYLHACEREFAASMDPPMPFDLGPVLYRDDDVALANAWWRQSDPTIVTWRWNSGDGSPAHKLRAIVCSIDPAHQRAGCALANAVGDFYSVGSVACRQILGPRRLAMVRAYLVSNALWKTAEYAALRLREAVATDAREYVATLLRRQDFLHGMGRGFDGIHAAKLAVDVPLALSIVAPSLRTQALLAQRIAGLVPSDPGDVRLALAIAWQRVRAVA